MTLLQGIYPRRGVKRPETENPNEPGWNGRLISAGSGIFVVFALAAALWFVLTKL